MARPVIAVTMGCPAGVGPEIVAMASQEIKNARLLAVGDEATLRRAAKLRNVAARRIVPVTQIESVATLRVGQLGIWMPSTKLSKPPPFGRPRREDGRAQLAWIEEGARLVQAGIASALVTAPVSKGAIARSGLQRARHFIGHTEHLAKLLGARETVMAFTGASITTALVTTHIAIRDVPHQITKARVSTTTYWLARLLHALGKRSPHLAVASLNPHAGEGGLFGVEERTKILPGIKLASARLARDGIQARVVGPIGAETAFRKAAHGEYDGVVALYHDQATIPTKLIGFGETVNVTLGLPIVRTSVDHGTAYDIAGTGKADARGLVHAIELARRLTRH